MWTVFNFPVMGVMAAGKTLGRWALGRKIVKQEYVDKTGEEMVSCLGSPDSSLSLYKGSF